MTGDVLSTLLLAWLGDLEALRARVAELEADNERHLDRIVDLASDRTAYRELTQHALTALHTLTLERDQLRKRNRKLTNDLRILMSTPPPRGMPPHQRPRPEVPRC